MKTRSFVHVSWFLLAGLAGCYSPTYGGGQLQCSPQGECPQGFTCASDNRCYPPGQGPGPSPMGTDMAGTQRDMFIAPDMKEPPRSNFLQTKGTEIVDGEGRAVILKGVNWTGFETATLAIAVNGNKKFTDHMEQAKKEGVNLLRLPFRAGLLTDAAGLARLDEVVAEAAKRSLYVLLSRSYGTDVMNPPGLWYSNNEGYSTARFVDDWKKLAERYKNTPAVIGFDLHHELHNPATWGDDKAETDWRMAATNVGNEILKIHPNVLIFVQGVENIGGEGYWYGGNHKETKSKPVVLNVVNRVVYATNDYSPSIVPGQLWFAGADFAGKLPDKWKTVWGYLLNDRVAPVFLAGFGWKTGATGATAMMDTQWRDALKAEIDRRKMGYAFWRLNDDSYYATLQKADGAIERMVKDALKPPLY